MLKVLRRIIEEVNAAEDLDAALAIIVARVREATDSPSCTVFLLDHERGEFELRAAVGLHEPLIGKFRIPFGSGLLSLVAETEAPVNLADAQTQELYAPPPFPDGIDPYHGYLAVPIQHQRKLLGVLVVRTEEKELFDDAEEAFLVTISSQLANIIAHVDVSEKASAVSGKKRKKPEMLFSGVASVPGVGIGESVVVFAAADLDAVPDQQAENIDAELINFQQALAQARDEVRILGERLAPNLPEEEQALFDAYLKLLDSNTLISEIEQEIKAGAWAQGALRRVIKRHILNFQTMENEYLRERASDLEDLGRRILSHLQAENQHEVEYPEQTILIGDEVMASHLAEVPDGQLAGVVSAKGSSNSHVAILARALGVPTVMGVGDLPVAQLQKQQTVVDGYFGRVYFSPSKLILKEYQKLQVQEQALKKDLENLRDEPAETQDGHRIALYVNTGLVADVGPSLTAGAEGVGLYRTEIPFMMRDRFPTGEEQRIIYRQLLSAFSPAPVTMRTLDIGGDKQLPYFPMEDDNPFLGWRGIRISLDHPEVFRAQVRAMMRASVDLNNLRIMLPMISHVSEVDEALSLLRKAYLEVLKDGVEFEMPQVGVMIEVPSAVYHAALLAERVDFLSVGSNDLTQYLLAVDRNNARVANLYDSFHPAVLHALQKTVEGAHKEGKPVSVCGEMAGDPVAAVLLLAMGYDALSMSASAIPRVKWAIRQITMSRARKLLSKVMEMENSREIREEIEQTFEEEGLSSLVRGGR